ncbi:hypothetical protein BDZ89DRAFT_514655 [Hymenopellis radicata]|nr:hypothetical protein BDZ89DRAFT_514655 [Hymenopellis radicata]
MRPFPRWHGGVCRGDTCSSRYRIESRYGEMGSVGARRENATMFGPGCEGDFIHIARAHCLVKSIETWDINVPRLWLMISFERLPPSDRSHLHLPTSASSSDPPSFYGLQFGRCHRRCTCIMIFIVRGSQRA